MSAVLRPASGSVCSRPPAFPPGIPPAVDPADAGFQLVDNSVSAVEVGRHHAGGEAMVALARRMTSRRPA
ncbi:hypothetical protein MJ572_01635 [Escherichia coli]|nr:hypothetical protein MJ572_01635 [Escherichia coli]